MRAKIGVNGIIEAGRKYGFSIRVTMPYVFGTEQILAGAWKVYTQSVTSHNVDGISLNLKPF